ncbi:MAG: FIST C-terminal domain-containing protein [Thermanaeromonas sp.]|uniref:FIST signal transduction protein n=1 Tax=Thermanaeromonas sp. TaxID=2003697 RepID=UPI002437F8D6|nr:FIST N-terminal domain-containing protein [Thermanaeromonas sp.]MCG0278286.1 FIST C-terminal domain-containing protein [Thermanaeromonas sp.]
MAGIPELRVGVGFSDEHDAEAAVQRALEQALSRTGRPALTLVLTTEGYAPEEVLAGAVKMVGNSPLVGAWTPGIIFGFEVCARGVGVCTIGGEGIEAVTHLERTISACPFARGEKAGEALIDKGGESPGTVLLFPDGSSANISELLRGLYNAMGPDFKYIGGGSGDNLRFNSTYQFTEEGVGSDAIAAAVLRGINFNVELDHGWSPAGEPFTITRAEGRRVYEIDGVPAFERYTALVRRCTRNGFPYYGMQYPFGLPAAGGKFIIRDPLKAEEDGSILFVTEIPENTIATIMEGDAESLVAAAGRVAESALNTPATPKVLILFDCVSRYLLLGKDFSREMEAIARRLKPEIPVFGMLSFGEISSVSGTPLFYNKTIVAAAGW